MARKRVVGRARPVTPQSAAALLSRKANVRLEGLAKSGMANKYVAQKMRRLLTSSGAKIKNNKIVIDFNITEAQARYIAKTIQTFLRSGQTSRLGIEQRKKASRDKLKQSLGELADGKEITDEDVDDFYEAFEDEDYSYFSDKIGPSEMFAIINEAKSKNVTADSFASMLSQFMTVNSEEARNHAKNLYEKYVL